MTIWYRTLVAAVSIGCLTLSVSCSVEPGSSSAGDARVSADEFDPDLVAAAQQEGEVVVYTAGTRQDAEMLAAQFNATFGVPVRFVRDETGGVIQSIESQVAANSVTSDVVVLGDSATLIRWSEEDVAEFVEVGNSADFREGFYDPSAGAVPIGTQAYGIAYNTANVEAPTSWAQVAAGLPGPLALGNPNTSGGAAEFYAQMAAEVGENWLPEVLSNNEVLTAESNTTLPQLVISGEADYALPGAESLVLVAKQQGEPIDIAFMEEGVPTSAMNTAALVKAPHPAAAKLLVQFAVHPSVQVEFGRTGGLRSVLSTVTELPGGQDMTDLTLFSPDREAAPALKELVRQQWNEFSR